MNYLLMTLGGVLLFAILILIGRKFSSRTERLIYTTILLCAGPFFIILTALGDNPALIPTEFMGFAIYGGFALLSLRFSHYFLALGWFLHPLWDFIVHQFGPENLMVPEWINFVCLGFDISLGIYIFFRISQWKKNA